MSNNLSLHVQTNRNNFIKALRSGSYEQIYGAYSKQGCFCAAGLAMNLVGPEVVDIQDHMENMLTEYYMDYKKVGELVDMNDEEEMSFNEIADALVNSGFLSTVDYRSVQPSFLNREVTEDEHRN